MRKKNKSSLFKRIFLITFLLTSFCCMMTYGVLAWMLPQTYSTTLDASLDHAVNGLLAEIENLTPLESGSLMDEFIMNQNGVLVQLFDDSNREIELPSQDSELFPVFITSGMAAESADPEAYRATHSYIFTFGDSEEVYTLTVAGNSQEVNLLKDTLDKIFFILFFSILSVSILASIIYSRYVTKPVLHISHVAKQIAELDFSGRCEENRTDELGILANSLNEMSQKLSASMEELRCANEKLQEDIAQERALEKAQLDFFSAVSHELKTPVTIIKGQTEGMLLNVGDYKDRNKYLARSLEIINTMEQMVQEILTVSRIKSSKVGIKKERIQFSEMLRQNYARFEDLIVQKRIEWDEQISPDLCIVGDKTLIQKVINNLISNAITYSPEGSIVYLTAFEKKGVVQFLLENTGVHIPDAELPKLFDAFYRIEHSRNKKMGGSGLGLYIVKTILEQHQAEYSLRNTKRGVLFTIQFKK